MSLWSKIRGTITTIFQIGLGGPQIKNNSSVLEARNSADSGYVKFRCAAPVGDNDAATKLYVDSLDHTIFVTAQFDDTGDPGLPANTASRRFLVTTTAGADTVVGDVLYDDGTAVGTMVKLVAVDGREIAVKAALAGGTVSFDADSIYLWDGDGSAWVKIGDVGAVTGAVRVIRFVLDNSATQDSVAKPPAANRVLKCRLQITTPYSGGTTISIGQPTALTAFMTTADNDPVGATAGDIFDVDLDVAAIAGPAVVRVTVAGAPAAGAGVCTIWHANPDA